MNNKETCYQWRRHYVRENKNNLCPTLTANMGTGVKSIYFTSGGRIGKQISRDVPSRAYKYTNKDCDLIIEIDTKNGDCYIIHIDDILQFSRY